MAAEKVLMDGAIRIFKRTDKVSKYWQARFKLDDHPKPVIKSTKKSDIEDAAKWAKEEFYRLVAKKEVGLNVTARTFAVVARDYLKEAEQDAEIGTRSARSVKDAKAVIERYMVPFFGKMAIDAVSHEQIDNFKRWRATYWTKGPGSTETEITFQRRGKTVKIKRKPKQRSQRSGELSYLRAVFKFAIRKGWIKNDDIPLIESDKRKKNRRPAFTQGEADYITAQLYIHESNNNIHPAIQADRMMLRDYLMVLLHSGIRPGKEHQQLKWRDVEFFKQDDVDYVCLWVSDETKTGKRQAFCQPEVVPYLRRLQSRSKFNKPDDPVFAHQNTGDPIKSFTKGFKSFLEGCGLTKNRFGEPYTPYSLRHTYISLRLERGNVDVYLLARNTGTSVEMISKHYGQDDIRRRLKLLTRGNIKDLVA